MLSHLSGDATEMGGTRQAFEALAGELVRNLTAETHRKTLLALKAKSQTGGYREYNETSIWCVVMVPLGTVPEHRAVKSRPETHALQRHTGASEQRAKEQRIDIATFHSNHQWLGLLREQVVEAIDGSRRRPIPGSPPWHAGLLMYRDAPIPVIDIARLMGSTAGTQGRDVIVVRPSADTPMVGLMIDELAGIPEVPVSRILSMADIAQRGGAVIADRAVRPDQPEDPVLLIINLEQLLLHTSVTQPAGGGQFVHKASPA